MPKYTTAYLLKFSEQERRQLDEEAARRGVSRAALIRQGLALVSGRTAARTPADRADQAAPVVGK